MIDVLNLALPLFGVILIGFACGKLKQIADTALASMNFFILFVALPALFYRILARTPLEKLAQVDGHRRHHAGDLLGLRGGIRDRHGDPVGQYDVWVERASIAVLIGTLVSVVTLTSVMRMVKTGTLTQLLSR
ncbi:MAG TPA: hypothetical protein VGF53_06900 [Pseudolabrys sp.]|jgi:predicted permease